MVKKIKRFLDWTEKISFGLVVVLFTVMIVAIFLQVGLRYIFNTGNAWSEELARYSFVWLVLLGSAVAVRKDKHMKIDIFINMLPPAIKIGLEYVLNIFLIIFLIVFIKYGFGLAVITHKQLATGLGVPMSWVYISIPFGGSLMLAYTLEAMYFYRQKGEGE